MSAIFNDLAEVWLLDKSPAYRTLKMTELYIQLGVVAIIGGAVIYIAATGLKPTPDPMKKFAPT